jgi:adenylate kinase
LAKKLGVKLLALNEWIKERGLGEPTKDGTLEVDVQRLSREFLKQKWGEMVVEGHLSHYLPSKLLSAVVVLRLNPKILEHRLKSRGYKGKKLRDNVVAEAIDLILVESLQRHGERKVFELDMTNITPEEAVDRFLAAWRKGKRIRDRVDWLGSLGDEILDWDERPNV